MPNILRNLFNTSKHLLTLKSDNTELLFNSATRGKYLIMNTFVLTIFHKTQQCCSNGNAVSNCATRWLELQWREWAQYLNVSFNENLLFEVQNRKFVVLQTFK